MHWTDQALRPRLQGPDNCCGPQAPTENLWGQITWPHIQHKAPNLKEKTLRYRFRMAHIPGVKNRAPGRPLQIPHRQLKPPPKMILHDDLQGISDWTTTPPITIPIQLMAGISSEYTPLPDQESDLQESFTSALHSTNMVTWDQVQVATSSDDNMLLLTNAIEDGFPESRHMLPQPIRDYHHLRHHLSCCNGVAIYKDRIIIPPDLRQSCLSALYAAHQGTSAMTSRAEPAIFWPGITKDIHATRANCTDCNRMASSQATLPPTPPTPTEYPFQCICADFFHHQGHNYLVIIDRYSNWPIVERARDGTIGLINILRHTFATYGIPDELSLDGGPEFTAHVTRMFLRDWGIHYRLSSVAFPHSNCQAEVGVKTVKRLITGNLGKDGSLNIDTFQQAMLQYRNSPDPTTKLSPAMCIFGRPTKDLIPIMPGKYRPHRTWEDSLNLREAAHGQRHALHQDKWSEHSRSLQPLKIGDKVRVQNQTGNHPLKWDKTGSVVEVRQFHQYLIRLDGSGRQSLHNRKFLRRYTPIHTPTVRRSILEDIALIPRPPLLRPADPPRIHSPPPVPTIPITPQPDHTPTLDNWTSPDAPQQSTPPARTTPLLPPMPPQPTTSTEAPTKINQATKATRPASLYYSVLTTPMVSRLGWR